MEFPSPYIRNLFCSAPFLAIALAMVGCGKDNPVAQGGPQAMPVQAARPYKKEIELSAIYTGRFVPVEEVELRARVSGYLESVHFDDGQKVKKGDLMFKIDPRRFEARVEAAEAQKQQVTARRDLAKKNFDRIKELRESRAISEEEVETRESNLAQAEADLLAAEADLKTAVLELEFTNVTAPIDGIANRYEVTPGNYITGGTAGADILTTIVPHDPIHCAFEVDERRMLQFTRLYFEGNAPGRDGEPVTVDIAVSDSDEFEFTGTIDFAENQLDAETATTRMRALVENDNEFLTPGLFAKVKISVGTPFDALLVRDAALGFDQSKRFAWVLGEDNTVTRRFVEVGEREGEFRIIESGLSTDESIVVTGIQLLRDGAAVSPTAVPMDPEAKETASPSEESPPDPEGENQAGEKAPVSPESE